MNFSPDRVAYAACVTTDISPQLDPKADFWRNAVPVHLRHDAHGNAVTGNDTEVRMAWTDDALHLLFLCQYEQLHLREGEPRIDAPTDELWLNDVAEIFIAAGASTPLRYMEFEVSPRGEWIALEIETRSPGQPVGRPLHAEAHFAASIDPAGKTWLSTMRIPFSAFDCAQPAPGMGFRMNLFISQGTKPVQLAWQPTRHASFHVPDAFGLLILSKQQQEG
ncbi:carbohydrate-binding family 9-like protein [Silvibacterium acidisoli]|uniref:carbohydrate-binding family 9-like protein n=1 Tax=Acidobacteriaceae bacterium ZG23-2 TaxID=2883246 RepID=UPI00406C70C5